MINPLILDTDIVSLFQRGHKNVLQNVKNYLFSFDMISFTELTWYEIIRGYRAIGANRQAEEFEIFCLDCNILNLDRESLDYAANIYRYLRQHGKLIGELDILIAGIALANGMGIATRNTKHFSHIPGLYIEDWTL
ncbi:type II toxin-antitoxin system VapC family toxin [Candidatus Poribacteria bacterium]|nr:type II toxin-antitoxin system VapC family toxin [Candidatus Poribacteria bacterium]